MYSKKATRINEIFTVDLTLCSKRGIDGEDFVNFRGLLRKYELYESRYKKSNFQVGTYLTDENLVSVSELVTYIQI